MERVAMKVMKNLSRTKNNKYIALHFSSTCCIIVLLLMYLYIKVYIMEKIKLNIYFLE